MDLVLELGSSDGNAAFGVAFDGVLSGDNVTPSRVKEEAKEIRSLALPRWMFHVEH
jgi:hypothetical protein